MSIANGLSGSGTPSSFSPTMRTRDRTRPTGENVASAVSHVQPVNQLHPTAVAEKRFVFDKSTPFDNGKGIAPAPRERGRQGQRPGHAVHGRPEHRVRHRSHRDVTPRKSLARASSWDPIAENGLPRVASVHLGDSFHFKQHGSDGSGDIAPAPWHAAVEPYAIKDGALHGHHSELSAGLDDPSDPSGHHEHAGVVHGSGRRRCLNRPRCILIRLTVQAQLTPTCRTISSCDVQQGN